MGKLIFAGRYSRKASENIIRRNEIGIDFDEIVLNCNRCGKQTSHQYKGYNVVTSIHLLNEIKFNYECVGCGRIQSFSERK